MSDASFRTYGESGNIISTGVDREFAQWLAAQIPASVCSPSQALAVRAFADASLRLLDYRDAIDELRSTFPESGLIRNSWGKLNDAQQRKLYNDTNDFFNAYYSAMERAMGLMSQFRYVFSGNTPPFRSVAKFIDWMRTVQKHYAGDLSLLDELERARTFRTMLTHSADMPQHTWGTVTRPGYELPHIFLYGIGRTPDGAVVNGGEIRYSGTWHAEPPDEVSVVNSFFESMRLFVHRIAGQVIHDNASALEIETIDSIQSQ